MISNFDLTYLNTFRLKSKAKYFFSVKSIYDLDDINYKFQLNKSPFLLIGGGSNLILNSFIDRPTIKIDNDSINIQDVDNNYVYVEVGAGVIWDNFIDYCIKKGFYGLENLTMIPGTVGAAPVQNIGAYGVEVSEFIDSVQTYDIENSKIRIFKNEECEFSYRNSFFKKNNKFIILSVSFKLNLFFKLNLKDRVLSKEIIDSEKIGVFDIVNKVREIRKGRLPDYNKLGNVGSFYTNPIVSLKKYNDLKSKYPELLSYYIDDNNYKISAGWLIEKCGFKGVRLNNIGMYINNPLVMVNYGNASFEEIISFSTNIKYIVNKDFNIKLSEEPIIYHN
ncbi:UDP-N-acetylmuramate dehydrogenase [Acinetobacter pittii]|uniref:UDP-N-acetylmuramate dehydrogenase n=1 Tax=Acinetobacter pittii TaxID=48296 RepID=UPI000D37B670|nr:UDP-N-acetylmuramate dehydrogenase [Acinetobacter pittii]PTV47354.1 hypothetical protein DBL01_16515 [Acinetobacter pittii]